MAVATARGACSAFVFHIHSTMRMGASAADSILDESAEARWVKSLESVRLPELVWILIEASFSRPMPESLR